MHENNYLSIKSIFKSVSSVLQQVATYTPVPPPLVVLCIGVIFTVGWVVLRSVTLARVLLSLIAIFSNMFSKVIINANLYLTLVKEIN